MKRRDLEKIVLKDGWRYSYSKGGHDHYAHPTKSGKVTFCGHPSDEVAPKTLISILKQAGLR
ncbi:type II toxin-antitoxin system HicA family toxin [Granulicella aggregans]|uniref:type II toxin-antitoxin system HicA family toxin n=1 Tax=Granulicella aggregans TaxID=474949 RepID=UPI0021DF72B3|nr:type II toxin-antitoxin system HicA family toxin [Granulicella aggregans]